ncbi:exosortase A [Lichenicola sp.]|uniref:exosortase A n=1 Tax=Lichenicola sp. TaxID=2804529 RepID=UPI003AFF67C9
MGATDALRHGRIAIPGAWAPALVPLASGLAVLLATRHAELAAALHVWSSSTAYGHCFLILPIAAWLAWDRRDRLLATQPAPMPSAAWLMLPATLLWLFAERLGVMEGRQLATLATVWVLVLAGVGPAVTRVMAIPLAYLVFLVPFGGFLVPALQDFTTGFIDAGLDLLGIAHVVDRTSIEIPEGTFQVAEACAGLRFLIASVAFGALYAALIYRRPARRIGFLLASVLVPVLANGIRALGIVVLGNLRGSAAAGAVDHVLYGWIFFSLVILLLVLLGLPFREDHLVPPPPPSHAIDPAQPQSVPAVAFAAAILAGVAVAALGPITAWALDHAAAGRPTDPAWFPAATLQPPEGCTRSRTIDATTAIFSCGELRLQVEVHRYPPHAGAGMILDGFRAAEAGLATAAGDADVEHRTLETVQGDWRLDCLAHPEMAVAMAVLTRGRVASGGLEDRLRMGWASFAGGAHAMSVIITARGPGAAATVSELARRSWL